MAITFQPNDFDLPSSSFPPPRIPLQISVPAPSIPEGSKLLVAQQLFTDFISESEAGLREQLAPADTASVIEGNIVTDTDVFPGILNGGLFAVLSASGSGFVTGTASDATGRRPGVVISNNTNTLIAVTDTDGKYTLFISGGPFTVRGFDPLRNVHEIT